ncbi:MAG TPA: gliding motility-associated C-terminal domain-containing protein [Bacteroidia bacterium]
MYRIVVLISFCCLLTARLNAQSVGGNTSGGTSYCLDANGSGFIGLSGHVGSIVAWQSSTDGGTTWNNTGNTTANQSYSNLSTTTCYRAIVKNGAFPQDTSTISCIDIFAPTVGGIITGDTALCGSPVSGTLNLSGNTGGVLNWQFSTNGGTTWTSVANTSNSLNFSGITVPTIYEVVVQNSPVCSIDTSSRTSIELLPLSASGSLALATPDPVCYGFNTSTINLSGNAGTVTGWLGSTDNGATWTAIPNTTTTQTAMGLTQTTWFAAIVKNGICPADTTTNITVNVLAPPAAVSAGPDTTIHFGQSVTLIGMGSGTPFWLPATGLSDPANDTTIATPQATTSYTLTITDANGCLNTDTIVVTVFQPKFKGTISNYFTPNGDNINDYWYIEGIQFYPKNEVFVYNIYGQQVYTKKGYNNEWKGTYSGSDLPDGTYYYILRFDDIDTVVKGSVDILRKK